jgi:hypothetical protein
VSALACDRCGRSLLVHEDVRYEVVIRVTAAYDPMELDLDAVVKADVEAELDRLREVIERRSAEELEADVFKEFTFDLCGRCQKEYLRDPLPRRPSPD